MEDVVSGVRRGCDEVAPGLTIGYVAHKDNPRWGLGRHFEEEFRVTSSSMLSEQQAQGWEEVSNMPKVLWESHMPEVDRPGPLFGTASSYGWQGSQTPILSRLVCCSLTRWVISYDILLVHKIYWDSLIVR